MLTIEQIRAARALLGWSQSDLAERADLSQTGIARIENGTNRPNSKTLQKIHEAFDQEDIEFLGVSGLRKKTGDVKLYKDSRGFRDFTDDVYQVTAKTGGEICLHNARPQNWYKWLGEEWYENHAQRMSALENDFEVRITAEYGNPLFIASDFAEYRWIPEDLFTEQSFYAYGNKLALMHFEEDSVKIHVLDNMQFAKGFRALFNIAWEHVAMIPGQAVKTG